MATSSYLPDKGQQPQGLQRSQLQHQRPQDVATRAHPEEEWEDDELPLSSHSRSSKKTYVKAFTRPPKKRSRPNPFPLGHSGVRKPRPAQTSAAASSHRFALYCSYILARPTLITPSYRHRLLLVLFSLIFPLPLSSHGNHPNLQPQVSLLRPQTTQPSTTVDLTRVIVFILMIGSSEMTSPDISGLGNGRGEAEVFWPAKSYRRHHRMAV